METLATSAPVQALTDFCDAFLSRHNQHWPPAEGTLAREFAEQFSPRLFSSAGQIVEFARGLGIDASLKALPDGIQGFNGSTTEQTIIILSEQESVSGSREHTFFHELREILEYRFRDLGFPTAQGQELEKLAEQFALEVRMASLVKEFGPLFENAQGIEQTWKRWASFAGLLILTLGVGASCFLLPYFEKNLPAIKSK